MNIAHLCLLSALITHTLGISPLPLQAQEVPAELPSPDSGWHFTIAFGANYWGRSSPCACNNPLIEIAGGYEGNRGLGGEYRLGIVATNSETLANTFALSYYPKFGGRKSFPLAAVAELSLLPDLGRNFSGLELGYGYGYAIRGRAALGRRKKTRVFGEIGVSTARQRYREDRFGRGDVITRQVHSGLRVRLGIVW